MKFNRKYMKIDRKSMNINRKSMTTNEKLWKLMNIDANQSPWQSLGSKSVPKLPKSCPRAPQTSPKQAREVRKPLQKRARQAPRRVLAATVSDKLVQKALRVIFCDFSRCARCLRRVFRSTKTVVLLHFEHLGIVSAHAGANVEK